MNPNQDVQAKILNCAIDTDAARVAHTYDRDLILLVRSAASSIVVSEKRREMQRRQFGVEWIALLCLCMYDLIEIL